MVFDVLLRGIMEVQVSALRLVPRYANRCQCCDSVQLWKSSRLACSEEAHVIADDIVGFQDHNDANASLFVSIRGFDLIQADQTMRNFFS